MDFITVYSKATGLKQRVPEHWMTVPTIARNFTKTPRQRRREADERAASKRPEPVADQAADNTEPAAPDETPAAGDPKE